MIEPPLVEIWSTYPPPFGGVSVHSMRLFETLKENEDIKLIFKDFNGLISHEDNRIIKIHNFPFEFFSLFFKKSRIIHLHSNNISLWIAIGLLISRHKFLITIHNQNLRSIGSWYKKILLKKFLKKVKFVILNDPCLSDFLTNEYSLRRDKIITLPAFIPPLKSEEIGLDNKFFEFRSKFEYVISTFASKLYKKNNVDVYGIRDIIHSLDILVRRRYSIGLIVIIPIINDKTYYKELLDEIKGLNLSDNILIYTESIINAFEIWKLSNVYVRATNTDIEGLAIKEALHFNIPVVASDVVLRPEDVILYKFGNLNDLTEKIIDALSIRNFKCSKQEIQTCKQILSLYKSIK